MRRLAIVLVQAGLFFGVTGACSSDEEHPPTPTRIMRNPGGGGGSDGGGSSGTGGSTGGESGEGGLGQGGVQVAGAAGAGGDPLAGGAGGVVDTGGAGGVVDTGGAGGVVDTGGAGGVVDTGGAGGVVDTGGAGGAGGSASVQCLASQTITVVPASFTDWLILAQNDPTLTLCRGNTYTFAVNATNHLFYIKGAPGNLAPYFGVAEGVTNNGVAIGDVVYVVPDNAPDTVYYNCGIHGEMGGTLNIVN